MADMQGLTSQQAHDLIKQGKSNQIPSKSNTSVLGIVLRNVFTYFNAIFAGLATVLIITGSFKSLTFLPVVIANMVIGIVQQLRAKKVLDKLALLDTSEYVAIRDGVDTRVASDLLVLGDLVRLESGQQIPADAVVVSGEAHVNESLLTGEADEIPKQEGDELKSGSFLVSGTCVAKLTHVGADSYVAQLTAKAKEVKDRQSEMIHDIESIVRAAGIVIIPIGAALYYFGVYRNGLSIQASVTSMVGAVTGMIPEGLYLLVTVALALSASRLARKQVLLHDMRSIETLARVDVLCADKTGTITSDVMNVSEIFGPAGEVEPDLTEERAILASYTRTVPDANITMNALRSYFAEAEPLDATEVQPFSSKTKYSQVRVGNVAYRFGAPEYLLSNDQLEDNRDALEARTGTGKRVLALVQEDEEGSRPLLFVAMRNEIRENAPATFAAFAEQGVDVKVISGDNPMTVASVAAEAGIQNADKFVDAGTLDTPEKIREAVRTYTVFGRVKPEQKKQLVEALKADGLRVAMTGDGVNDILAMKEADCSIAMGGGSDAARQAAQVVLLDSDFSHMRDIVGEGRRNINNITRSATLFLYKNIFSFLLATFSILLAFNYPLQPTQVSLISMFNIGLPAFFLALEPNEQRQKGRFIKEVLFKSLPAALTSFFAIGAMMYFADVFDISDTDVATASTYLLSVVGFLILIGLTRPANRYRATVVLLCMVGFVAGCGFFYQMFDIRSLSLRACVLCVVFAIAEVTVMRTLEDFNAALRAWIERRAARA